MDRNLGEHWEQMRAGMLADHLNFVVGLLDELLEKLDEALKAIDIANKQFASDVAMFDSEQLDAYILRVYTELCFAEEEALDEYRGSKFAEEFWMFVRAAAAHKALKELMQKPKKTFADGIADGMEISNERARAEAEARSRADEEPSGPK